MKTKPNYELKAKVIENGLTKLNRQIHLTIYQKAQEDKIKLFKNQDIELYKPLDFDFAIEMYEYLMKTKPEEMKEAERVNYASYKRTKRLNDRIKDMMASGSCIFLTLTFKPDILEGTTSETRRKYVIRYLKKVSTRYIANIDFGKKNEREHYHAVVLADSVDGSWWRENCGAINFERINYQAECDIKISKYINKLTNHAIKETTKRSAVIYSR